MFSRALEISIDHAFERAKNKRHEFITVEHLLLALLDNPDAIEVLIACGADLNRLKIGLGIFIDETTPLLSVNDGTDIQPTLGFQRVLQRSIIQVQTAGKSEVTGANVLIAIFGEEESQSVYFLSQENVTRFDVVNYISHGISKVHHHHHAAPSPLERSTDHESNEGLAHETALERFAVNLNEQAKVGKIGPLIGRKDEIMHTIQVLCRRHKKNPLLVGDAGVGKTAIAEGLAKLIIEKMVPEPMLNSTIFALDLGMLLAGTKYRGDFEKRFKEVLKDLRHRPGAIVFIDEIHTIIGAGAASGGTMDASNLLKPLLSSEIRCIGSTTYQEYRAIFEKDRALTRRFQKIDIGEPSVNDTYKILCGLKDKFESYHSVKYTFGALRAAAELSHRYINERHLPDKAIDVIDEAGAFQRLQPINKKRRVISDRDIEEVIAKIARIPALHITMSDQTILKNIEENLGRFIFGQDQAISSLCTAIKLARSGLREPGKPVASFLFAGPTGVGKTEVTRQLAKALGIELIRFDMSEYMERHTVSRLIGAPPGYVGYDQGGLLTEAINKHPYSILLLDEIEKAHPDVYNLLLQVMDHGKLTDNNGRTADFCHVIVVMTTNAGAELLERSSIGFIEQDGHHDVYMAINKLFTPEFRNRLDSIIYFYHLSPQTLHKIVDKFLQELDLVLSAKGVKLNVDYSAKVWLAQHGYDKKMGARPMSRLIQEEIKKPLADKLLFGDLTNGGVVTIQVESNKLSIRTEKVKGGVC
jgi:ATP-dependent Clp protease ATP-binding subunit ClpA